MFYKWDTPIPKEHCEFLISFYEKKGKYSDAKTCTNEETTPIIRKAQLKWLDTDELIVRAMRDYTLEANSVYFKYEITGHELTQFGKYENSDHYSWHKDSIGVKEKSINGHRKLTTSILLSDPTNYEGGVFEFYGGDETIIPEISQGTVFVFDSQDWHRVSPVISGVRYSITQWSTGPQLK